MKSFIQFFNEQYLFLENLNYYDKTIFRKLQNVDPSVIPSKKMIMQAVQDLQRDNKWKIHNSQDDQENYYNDNQQDNDYLQSRLWSKIQDMDKEQNDGDEESYSDEEDNKDMSQLNDEYEQTDEEKQNEEEENKYAENAAYARQTEKRYSNKMNYSQDIQKQQLEYLKTYKKDPNSKQGIQAKSKLITIKQNYIYAICHRFIRAGIIKYNQFDDSVSEGIWALITAIDKFDYSLIDDKPFEMQISRWNSYIRSNIEGKIRNMWNPERRKSVTDIGKTIRKYNKDQNGNVTYSFKTAVGSGDMINVDEKTGGNDGQDKQQSVGDKIANTDELNPSQKEEKEQLKDIIEDCLNQLPQQYAKALRMTYLQTRPTINSKGESIQKNYTLEQIGKVLGMSKQGAKALIDRAQLKMRDLLNARGITTG